MSEILVVKTGVANTASVEAAFRRLGLQVRLSDEASRIADADLLVLPGVGTFGSAMARLQYLNLAEVLSQRVKHGRATLAICLGLQLLGRGSAESPETPGLKVVNATATRFVQVAENSFRSRIDAPIRVPQLGWNTLKVAAPSKILRPGDAYFANSYRWEWSAATADSMQLVRTGWTVAWADHGGPFVAAIERGVVLGCQFHPELSGDFGRDLLARWLEAGVREC